MALFIHIFIPIHYCHNLKKKKKIKFQLPLSINRVILIHYWSGQNIPLIASHFQWLHWKYVFSLYLSVSPTPLLSTPPNLSPIIRPFLSLSCHMSVLFLAFSSIFFFSFSFWFQKSKAWEKVLRIIKHETDFIKKLIPESG